MAELNWLRHFYFVARESSFTRAAAVQRIAQPAVSKAVKQLEEQLGIQLFERRGRQIVLTRSGGDVFRYCQVIFDQVARIDGLGTHSDTPMPGSLHIGAAEGLTADLLPGLMARFHGLHPEVLLSVTTSTGSDLCQKVKDGQLEACLLLHSPRLPGELRVQRRYPLTYKLVVASSCYRDPAVRATFIGSREVDDSSTKSFPTLRRLQKDLPHAAIAISSNSLSAHKRLVLEGVGVSILPLFMVKNELRTGKLRSLYDREQFQWPAVLVMPKARAPALGLSALLPHIDKAFARA